MGLAGKSRRVTVEPLRTTQPVPEPRREAPAPPAPAKREKVPAGA